MALVEADTTEVIQIGETARPAVKDMVASYGRLCKAVEPLSKTDPEVRRYWGDIFSDKFGNHLAVLNNCEYSPTDAIANTINKMAANRPLIGEFLGKLQGVEALSEHDVQNKVAAIDALADFQCKLETFYARVQPQELKRTA